MTDSNLQMLREAIIASPYFFPLQLDPSGELVQFVQLTEADYQAASFLDNRILRPDTRRGVVKWQDLRSIATNLTPRCDFIFHISHAGSTLMSRLIGSHSAFLSLREPAILRELGNGRYAERIETFLGLWSRTFRPEQRVVIKATSYVSEIAIKLMESSPHSRAVLMYVPLATFLPALLDGAMGDITSHAELRLKRIQQHDWLVDVPLASLSPGESVAMSWLSEMLSLATAKLRFPDRTLWVDFDNFLATREDTLRSIFKLLGVNAQVEPILTSSIMHRYAKKTEVAYDTAFRAKLLKQGYDRFADEIARGLAWLERDDVSQIREKIESSQ